jgi:hypothetical protein
MADNWIECIPGECVDLDIVRWENQDLGLYYADFTWHARGDLVSIPGRDTESVLWWIYPVEAGVSWNAALAAAAFRVAKGVWPSKILIQKLPEKAKKEISAEFSGEVVSIPLEIDPAIPFRFVAAI